MHHGADPLLAGAGERVPDRALRHAQARGRFPLRQLARHHHVDHRDALLVVIVQGYVPLSGLHAQTLSQHTYLDTITDY